MTRNTRIAVAALIAAALLVVGAILTLYRSTPLTTGHVPDFSIPLGAVHPPLPTRIVSFHRGHADKDLVKLAAQLGFNGVQLQIEGSNERGLADFAARDADEHLVDYCHKLGMKVTVWVHEFSDLPGPWMPEYVGPVGLDNPRLWAALDQRYERLLTQVVPNIDGLVLTVVETQYRATDTPLFLKLVDLVNRKCQEHGKFLIVRTFVWRPDELADLMQAVKDLPSDMQIMSKVVPQDWQMRGAAAPELGQVGGRPQIVEFDAAGEYFLKDTVANCMVDLLKRQFDDAVAKGAQGICVRVDRDDASILWQPNEVNLWALGLLASGATSNTTDIWNRWATYRYGARAAPAVIRALEHSSDVVAEMLSIGPFTFGDTRDPLPPLPWQEAFTQNWQNWRWDPSFMDAYQKAETGDPAFVAAVARHKQEALALADQCLAELEKAKPDLPAAEYAILRTRLLTNQWQLSFRAPMAMAALYYRQRSSLLTDEHAAAALQHYKEAVAQVREAAAHQWPPPDVIYHLGRSWSVNVPDHPTRESLYLWAYEAQSIVP